MKTFKSPAYKSMNCKDCGSKVDKVDAKATAVICSKCVSKMVGGREFNPELEELYGKNIEHSAPSNEEPREK